MRWTAISRTLRAASGLAALVSAATPGDRCYGTATIAQSRGSWTTDRTAVDEFTDSETMGLERPGCVVLAKPLFGFGPGESKLSQQARLHQRGPFRIEGKMASSMVSSGYFGPADL
jgi:hypothetical protein